MIWKRLQPQNSHAPSAKLEKAIWLLRILDKASQNLANIAMAGVTRWQPYLYSYESMLLSIVRPFEETCLVLWRSHMRAWSAVRVKLSLLPNSV